MMVVPNPLNVREAPGADEAGGFFWNVRASFWAGAILPVFRPMPRGDVTDARKLALEFLVALRWMKS